MYNSSLQNAMVYLPFGNYYLSWNKMRCLHLNLFNPIFYPAAFSKNKLFYILPRINMPNSLFLVYLILIDNCYQNIKHTNKSWILFMYQKTKRDNHDWYKLQLLLNWSKAWRDWMLERKLAFISTVFSERVVQKGMVVKIRCG